MVVEVLVHVLYRTESEEKSCRKYHIEVPKSSRRVSTVTLDTLQVLDTLRLDTLRRSARRARTVPPTPAAQGPQAKERLIGSKMSRRRRGTAGHDRALAQRRAMTYE